MADENALSLDRRRLLETAALAASAAVMPRILGIPRAFAQAGSTMVVAAPATPQSLDCVFDVSLGTFEAIGALYDGLLGFDKIPDANVPVALREDIAFHPEKPGGVNMHGKLAESWEIDPSGRRAVFKLRQGVKSNWGNELTAEDVKWTWDRSFALGASGAFYTTVSGLTRPDDVKVEDKYTVSFNTDSPNPLLLKIDTNLYTPVYDSKKCKEAGGSRRSLGTQVHREQRRRLRPVRAAAAGARAAGGVQGQGRLLRRQAGDRHGDLQGGADLGGARVQLLRGGAVDIAQYLQPLEVVSLRGAPNIVVETVPASFMIWVELNAKIEPFDKVDVRRAMNYAFPQAEVMKAVFQGLADPLRRLHARTSTRATSTASSPTTTTWTRPRSCWPRPASVAASRRRSPTTPAIRCRSRSPSSTRPRCGRSASSSS